jgi:hypothetical protein
LPWRLSDSGRTPGACSETVPVETESESTFVNGTAIRRSPLQPGDRIRLADVDLVFER